jgi:hypothetical protein
VPGRSSSAGGVEDKPWLDPDFFKNERRKAAARFGMDDDAPMVYHRGRIKKES